MKRIEGQVIYMGPHIRHLGLGYGTIYRNGIHEHLYASIDQCPALGELFIPVAEVAAVRKALNFDYAHNMRGTAGNHVTLYREIQKWLAARTQQPKPPPASGLTIESHHA
jgi:hypothetical protein